MTIVYLDFESRSRVNLKTEGLDRYMTDAEPTIATWAVENGPVRLWDMLHERQPKEFTNALFDPTAIFIAHNYAFDRAILRRRLLLDTDIGRWRCTRAQAYAHGLPGGLEGLGAALGIPVDFQKLADGKRLIQLFCVPDKNGNFRQPEDHPDDWEAFKTYAMRDIDALRSIHRRLPTSNYKGENLRYFWLDGRINERGFAIDLPLIEATVDLLQRAKRKGDAEVERATGGAVQALTQRDRLLEYLKKSGVELPNLRKSELEAALQDDGYSPEQRFLIAARLEGARASGAKYKKALAQHVDGRLRYTQQFSGAGRTGRTAHKGFQPGNTPRAVTFNSLAKELAKQHVPVKAEFIDEIILPAIRDGSALQDSYIYGGPNTCAANALRHSIIAAPGNELVVADYKQIESVVLAWIADEPDELKQFRESFAGVGQDSYRLLYARFFGGDPERVTDHERQAGKVVKLACGFGGSVGAFSTMSVGYGLDLGTLPALVLSRADDKTRAKAAAVWRRAFLSNQDYGLEPDVFQACHCLVQKYRAAVPRIDDLKKQLGRAVEGAVRMRETLFEAGRCRIWATANLLIVELPNGYRLCYWHPELEAKRELDPETGEEETKVYLTFMRARGGKMVRERSWSGLIVENVVQAIANQVLRAGKLEIDRRWPDSLVLAVHDEPVAEAPIGEIDLEEYIALMCKGWPWSRGLPLAADGWKGPRYGKR